ncbi:MAG: hypothetical protein ABEI39_05410, partial [Halobacteriales archaeon]
FRMRWLAADEVDAQVREYWDWLAIALFLLVTVDMLTTAYAARAVGLTGEANPLVRWSLASGPGLFAGVNLVTVVAAVALFDRLLDRLERTPSLYDRYFAAAIEAWLGGLLAAGLLVFANNLAVIVHGRSLL